MLISPKTSEQYLDRIRQIPPAVVHGPSPGFSQPDEGSIAEKEFSSFDEKTGEEKGFFEPEGVDKELADLRVDEQATGRQTRVG